MRRNRALAVVVLGLVLQAGALAASAFKVTPVRVTFTGPSSTLLTLKNESDQPLRFQISSYVWSQDPKGGMQLTPTDDIAFFPTLLTLNAGEERKVRVATTLTAAGTEKTYRIFFEELPPLEKPESSGAQVRILTKMGIPIFLAPEKANEDASIESVQMQKGTLTFDVRNGGNVHFALDGVKLRGLGSNGDVLFERHVEGWYVLAGSLRSYSVDVPADVCSKLKKIAIEADTDIQNKATITKEFEVTPALCK